MRILLGNKYDNVYVICTYIGSRVENRICKSRLPEMTFHLFPTLRLIHICVQVRLQCNHALAGGAHTYRINMNEQNGYKGKKAGEGVNQRINAR